MARFLILALAAVSLSCQGKLSTGPAGPLGDLGSCEDGQCADPPSPMSRAPLISNAQWEAATTDLLDLAEPSGLSSGLETDAGDEGFHDGGSRVVGETLRADFQGAAEALATAVTNDPDALARVLRGGPITDEASARAWIRDIGRRAHRRLLTPEQENAYYALFVEGPTFEPELDPFVAGVRIVLMAMLQSPHFVYRVELSDELRDGVVPLDDFEIASRLSFSLWDTMPDDALLDIAEAGELSEPTVLAAQVERMLDDPRTLEVAVRFHHTLMHTSDYEDIDREGLPSGIADQLIAEPELLVRDVYQSSGGLRELLTAPYTFGNGELATLYGEVGDDTVQRIDLDPARRAGLLTQIGFLAHNAQDFGSDPIHRGVFVNRSFICAPLPAPPADAPSIPASDDVRRTLRERIELHTGPGTCGARCHGTMINPIGFAYENYDQLGRWRETDNELPVDASGEYVFPRERSGAAVRYDGAAELHDIFASTPDVHECYAERWLSYLYGRRGRGLDDIAITRIGQLSLDGEIDLRGIIANLVQSGAFLSRSTTELEVLEAE